jgi:tetratricopeptide (TPR) repeat protein
MKRRLEAFRRPLQPPAAIDEETRQAMAALGYLGSAGEPAEGPLPDPKAQLPSLASLKLGFQLMHERRWDAAERTFAGLVETNPRMVDAWEFLGRCRLKLDRPEAALAAYEEALRRSGGAPHVAQSVASILFDLGRFDEAAAHARLAESSLPSFTHGLLARIALRRGELDAAESSARLAMEGASERILPRLTLAEVLHARGELEEALATVKEAERLYGARKFQDLDLVFGLHLLEGKILADLGEVEPAAAAFREEIRLFPESPRAWASLALLQALSGRPREAAQTLRRMTESIPTAAAYAEAVRAYRALGDERGATVVLRHALGRFPDSRELRSLAAGA